MKGHDGRQVVTYKYGKKGVNWWLIASIAIFLGAVVSTLAVIAVLRSRRLKPPTGEVSPLGYDPRREFPARLGRPYEPVSLMRISSKIKKEKRARARKIEKAKSRTRDRMAAYPDANYPKMNPRDLAAHFGLGDHIFDPKNSEHTHTNKTLFKEQDTGRYICYDKEGRYSTVHDENDHYLALDGIASKNGQGEQFHFLNQ